MLRRTLLQFLGIAPFVSAPKVAYSDGSTLWYPHVSVVKGPHPNPASGYEWHCAMSMTCPVTGRRVVDMAVAREAPDAESEAIYISQLTNSLMMLMYHRMTNFKETT